MNRESRVVVVVAFFCGSKMEGEGIGGMQTLQSKLLTR